VENLGAIGSPHGQRRRHSGHGVHTGFSFEVKVMLFRPGFGHERYQVYLDRPKATALEAGNTDELRTNPAARHPDFSSIREPGGSRRVAGDASRPGDRGETTGGSPPPA
jgi:hypothetical protein